MTKKVLLLTCLLATTAVAPAGAGPGSQKKSGPHPDLMRIHVLNVGQGDCTVIESPEDADGDRRVMIVDAGETSMQGNEARDVVEPYLRRRLDDGPAGRPQVKVDYFVATHYHKDHIGWPREGKDTGFFYLYDTPGVKIDKVLDSGLDYDGAGGLDAVYAEWAENRDLPRETMAFDQLGEGRQIDLGPDIWVEVLAVGARVDGMDDRVLKPQWLATTSQNDFSIALVVHFKQFDFFVAGDLSGYFHKSWGNYYHNIEGAMSDSLRDLEVLRVSHHGSQWSTNYPFLQRTRPQVSVISCGQGHHHPNEYTVRRLLGWENHWTGWPTGSDVYQTEMKDGFQFQGPEPYTGRTQRVANGHIVIETDGVNGFSVWYEELGEPMVYPLDKRDAYTEVPDKILARRAGEGGDLPDVIEADEIDVTSLIEIYDEPRGD